MTHLSKGIRTVAIVVGIKGLLGILCALLVLSVSHKDLSAVVDETLAFVHLNPDGTLAKWVASAMEGVMSHPHLVMFMGFTYGAFKFIEGVGLWFEKRWAEWLVLVSTSILFIPLEIMELSKKVTPGRIGTLILSLGIIGFMGLVLYKTHQKKEKEEQGKTAEALS